MSVATLEAFLDPLLRSGEAAPGAAAETIRMLAAAAVDVADHVGQGAFGAPNGAERRAEADPGRGFDDGVDDLFLAAARRAPVALYASTQLGRPVLLDPAGAVALALDPLNGSADIEVHAAPGTFFSILPPDGDPAGKPEQSFRQPGRRQLAAGLFVYGARLSLVLTAGEGAHAFVYSRRLHSFVRTREALAIPPRGAELAIDASNTRHWPDAVRLYVDDCLNGTEGPRERDFALRWSSSLATEALRVLHRGGVFLAPADPRRGHPHGAVPLVCNANPLALLTEAAGGEATDAMQPILDLVPEGLRQRTALVFGAKREVERIGRYHAEPSHIAERAPLFGHRGLFRT